MSDGAPRTMTPQDEITLEPRSFTRGTINGNPCIVIYNDATDETAVIGVDSAFYAQAMAAFTIVEIAASPNEKPTVLHQPRIIRPGMQ